MTSLFQPLEMLAREAGDAARVALRRAALIGAAVLVASLGAGFLIFAAYLGLCHLLAPWLAAVVMGGVLLTMAGGVFLIARAKAPRARPIPRADSDQRRASTRQAEPADATTVLVFTTAFLIGRHLADRWGQSRNP